MSGEIVVNTALNVGVGTAALGIAAVYGGLFIMA